MLQTIRVRDRLCRGKTGLAMPTVSGCSANSHAKTEKVGGAGYICPITGEELPCPLLPALPEALKPGAAWPGPDRRCGMVRDVSRSEKTAIVSKGRIGLVLDTH